MMKWINAPRAFVAAAACVLALAGSAAAQNMSLRAPDWAQALLATDVTPTTGGRATLADGVDLSVRVTIAPTHGGVARVIRYDQRADAGTLAVRRFTGHPTTGWWLWGSDAPRITTPTAPVKTEIGALVRSASGVAATLGSSDAGQQSCGSDEQAYIEIAVAGRSTSYTRACITGVDPASRLATRMSEIAGSRTEEEFHDAAQRELLDADRAFAAKARADGVPAAFTAYASESALMVSRQAVTQGRDAVTQRFARWPQGARLEWAPEAGRVSERGDMGWTWGNSTFIAADGTTRTTGRYISVWTRDLDGNWRFAFDAAID